MSWTWEAVMPDRTVWYSYLLALHSWASSSVMFLSVLQLCSYFPSSTCVPFQVHVTQDITWHPVDLPGWPGICVLEESWHKHLLNCWFHFSAKGGVCWWRWDVQWGPSRAGCQDAKWPRCWPEPTGCWIGAVFFTDRNHSCRWALGITSLWKMRGKSALYVLYRQSGISLFSLLFFTK